jgi:hypothetical protein
MKTHLRKLIGTAVVGLVLWSNGISAWAGVASRHEVYINTVDRSAEGTMWGARSSSDGVQFIGCSLHAGRRVDCSAKDKNGNTAYCYSEDWRHVAAVKGIIDTSYVFFSGNPYGQCSVLRIDNSSRWLP